MLESIGRMLGRAFATAPLISSVVMICGGLLVAMEIGLFSGRTQNAAEVIAAKARQEAQIAAAKEEAEHARLEAAKSPEQRASEAAAAAAAEARREAEEAKRQQLAQKRGVAVERAKDALRGLKWWDQCARWGRDHRKDSASVAAEAAGQLLSNERVINQADIAAINAREKLPVVGMTACGAIALLGTGYQPNASTNAYSTRVQMVYRDRGIYVYVEGQPGDHNGLVTSISY